MTKCEQQHQATSNRLIFVQVSQDNGNSVKIEFCSSTVAAIVPAVDWTSLNPTQTNPYRQTKPLSNSGMFKMSS